MINSFKTLFEARERKFQQERLFRGESVDLVAKITTDGVMDTLSSYSISGVYQPTDELSGAIYSVDAEIVDGKAVLHWTNENDFGRDSYNVWGLLTKDGKAAYPICWRLMFAHSPSYPLSSVDPIPRTIDFSQYELLNAPWIELSALGEIEEQVVLSALQAVDGRYLPLSGGTVDGKVNVTDEISAVNFTAKLGVGINIGNNSISDNGVAIGVNSTAIHGSVAIGNGVQSDGFFNTAIGTSSKATGSFGLAIGQNSEVSSDAVAVGQSAHATYAGSLALGHGTYALALNAIQLGSMASGPGAWSEQKNTVPHSLRVMDKMVLSGDNLTLDPERVPYLSNYAKTADIPEVPTDLSAFTNSPGYLTAHQSLEDYYTKTQTDEKLTAYAQLSDLENIDVGEMSACLSSAEFTDVEELSAAEFVSLQDIVDKVNLVIQKLKRTWRNPSYTYIKYSDNTVLPMNITSIIRGHIPNIENVTDVEIGTAVTSIGLGALSGSALSSLVIPETVTYCAMGAFDGCPSLTSIEILSGHNLNFNSSCFLGCSATVTFDGRTKAEVSSAGNYSWGIPTGQGRIVCTDGTL